MKLKYDFVVNKVADSFVAVATGDALNEYNGFIKMNETGAFIFKLLKDDITEEKITEKLLNEYDTDKKTAEDSVKKFLNDLEEKGIICDE